jgi:hypothetical protein
MLAIFTARLNPSSVMGQSRRARLIWLVWFLSILGMTGVLAFLLLYSGPKLPIIAWLIFGLGIAAILYRPHFGVYLALIFSLMGDGILIPWYPFVKNFSSTESIFFIHNSLIISPLEVYLLVTLVSWLGRAAMERKFKFYTGPLFWPAMVFTAFIIFGIAYGLSRGGIVNVALWEARAIFYLPAMLVLVSNLITTRQRVNILLWVAMLAILFVGIYGTIDYFTNLKGASVNVDWIIEHATAVRMNTLFIFVVAVWMYRASPNKRFILPLMVPFVILIYLFAERRAAFLTLVIALAFMGIILFKENRRLFWMIIPPITLLFVVYLVAFWNSTNMLGLPANAVKSMIFSNQASYEDQLSNIYRMIENVNASFTIHAAPLTGVGFGNKFYIIIPMPDISFFVWWEYITHNSIIWIWMKSGVGGFLAMLFLIGMAVMTGIRVVLRMPKGDLSAIALTALLYIIMHFMYAYVDMSWDIQSMVYVGTMMGLLNVLEKIVSEPEPVTPKRWSWLPEPQPQPGFRPLTGEEI